MIARWTKRLLWDPFEALSRRVPLWPLDSSLQQPTDGVTCIRIDNIPIRFLSRISGGYDYAVSYLIDETLLIDTGFPWARRELQRVLQTTGSDRTINTVVNTHYHEDHTGNNDLLAELTDAKVLAHPAALPEIRFPIDLPWYRRFLFGPYAPIDVQPIGDEIQTRRFRFEVLHMPGHCPGHICLFEPERRWLFSGDLYIAPDIDSQLSDASGPEWIESLGRAIELEPHCLFDAHGTMILDPKEVLALLTRKLAFLIRLRERIQEFATKAQSIKQLTKLVFDRRTLVDHVSQSEGWMSLITGSDFSRANLVKSFLREDTRKNLEPSES